MYKFFNFFFGVIDKYSQWIDRMFVEKKCKKCKCKKCKCKPYNPEDLFNGE